MEATRAEPFVYQTTPHIRQNHLPTPRTNKLVFGLNYEQNRPGLGWRDFAHYYRKLRRYGINQYDARSILWHTAWTATLNYGGCRMVPTENTPPSK